MFIWKGVEYPNLTFDRTTNQMIRKNGKPLKLQFDKKGYMRIGLSENGKQKIVLFHRLLYWIYHPLTSFDLQVDHIDRNRANNDLSNLRLATHRENCCNRTKKSNASSKYNNVCWDKEYKNWRTRLCSNRKLKSIGRYNSEREAAIAYNNYLIQNNLVDEFRTLNIIQPKKQVSITLKR